MVGVLACLHTELAGSLLRVVATVEVQQKLGIYFLKVIKDVTKTPYLSVHSSVWAQCPMGDFCSNGFLQCDRCSFQLSKRMLDQEMKRIEIKPKMRNSSSWENTGF